MKKKVKLKIITIITIYPARQDTHRTLARLNLLSDKVCHLSPRKIFENKIHNHF